MLLNRIYPDIGWRGSKRTSATLDGEMCWPVRRLTKVSTFFGKISKPYTTSIFPLNRLNLIKNLHSINKFMTGGLLISRSNKNRLHKLSITSRSIENSTTYRNYRNIYNSVLRASKKIFLEKISNLIVKILKGFGSSLRMHQLAKKRATLSKKSMSMEKL